MVTGTEVHGIHGSLGVDIVARTGTYAYFVEPPVQYITMVEGTAHPGAKHAFRSSVVSDILSAVGRVVTEERRRVHASSFFPFVLWGSSRVGSVLRMSARGFPEGAMHAERIPHECIPPLVVSACKYFSQSALQLVNFLFSLIAECAVCGRLVPLYIPLHVDLCFVSGQCIFPASCWRLRLL